MSAQDHAHPPQGAGERDDSHGGLAHVMEPMTLLAVWGALMVLTILTVAALQVDLGPFNIWIAMGIATVKAALVALYFMHLRYDSPFNAVILVTSLLFVTLFIGLTLVDTLEYKPTIIPEFGDYQRTP